MIIDERLVCRSVISVELIIRWGVLEQGAHCHAYVAWRTTDRDGG